MRFRTPIATFSIFFRIFAAKIKMVDMEYNKNIVGRRYEQEVLHACVESPRAEFIAVYGRRCIGKTFLVKQFFNDTFDFYTTGVYQVSKAEQLRTWQEQLRKYSGVKRNKPKDWFEAFGQLEEFLETKREQDRIIIFIDELPWLDTPKSNFIRALELFWNSWASTRQVGCSKSESKSGIKNGVI